MYSPAIHYTTLRHFPIDMNINRITGTPTIKHPGTKGADNVLREIPTRRLTQPHSAREHKSPSTMNVQNEIHSFLEYSP